MTTTELLLIAIGLAMDAFAVSICKGLSVRKIQFKHYITVGIWFGGFQALMPTIGYFFGTAFSDYIEKYDHWIAFILLGLIGISMIRESFSKDGQDENTASFGVKAMSVLAIATSIDALVVGVTFALLPNVRIVIAIALIGVITFIFSVFGIKIGNVFGLKYKSKAEFFGGLILILIGAKILTEHLLG